MSDLSFLYYELPPEKIAQRPAAYSGSARSESRLLHAEARPDLQITDRVFSELSAVLRPHDLLVLNNTRVVPCRFFARKEGRAGEIEIFLLSKLGDGCAGFPVQIWEALGRPLKKLNTGDRLRLSENLWAEVLGRRDAGRKIEIKVWAESTTSDLPAEIAKDALMPIPPYIRDGRSDDSDKSLYQTVFADAPGSVAAPTAGLHFTEELLSRLSERGVRHRFITLHVGQASITMIPEKTETSGFKMPSESYSIAPSVWEDVCSAKRKGRVIAVGTTTTRALESYVRLSDADRRPAQFHGSELFIRPGHEFKVVDALVTNFHQPGSTHLMLVAAFIGAAQTRDIYTHALDRDYRFLSYGDAMFLEIGQGQ